MAQYGGLVLAVNLLQVDSDYLAETVSDELDNLSQSMFLKTDDLGKGRWKRNRNFFLYKIEVLSRVAPSTPELLDCRSGEWDFRILRFK